MSAIETLSSLLNMDSSSFSKVENVILEAELFARIYNELTEIFKIQNRPNCHLIKSDTNREEDMLNANVIRCMINDILSTEEYSLLGIANYTHIPEEVVYDLAIGKNSDPSLVLSRKILELHRSVRTDLYREIIKKITVEYVGQVA